MSDWYADLYANDASAENPFGSELLAERSNSALLEYLRLGGSMSDMAARHLTASFCSRTVAPTSDGGGSDASPLYRRFDEALGMMVRK